MPEKPAELPGGDEGPGTDGWYALAAANPTLLLQGLGSECTGPQGLRELTVNGPAAIAALDEDRAGRVMWDLDWGGCDPSAPARSPEDARASA